jgi:hypothetical protein
MLDIAPLADPYDGAGHEDHGVDGPQLVLGWVRRGTLSDRIWAEPTDRPVPPDRVARDVEVAEQSDALFRDLLGDHDHLD